jgi:hypothetical protein
MSLPFKKLKALVDRESPKKKAPEDDELEGDGTDDAKLAKYVEEEGEKVNDKGVDPETKKLLKDYDPDHNPASWVRDEAKWERAKEAVDPEGEGAEKYDEPYAVVVAVYKRMGGRIKSKKG